jgi:hypothetical protein
MNIKWTALIIWSVAFLLGLGILLYRFNDAGLVPIATRRMSVNHLLEADDLKGPKSSTFVGMYLKMNVLQGEIITPGGLSSTPLLYTDVFPWLAIPTSPIAVRQGTIDVKSKGQICNLTENIAPAEVVALFCSSTKDMRPCIALVSLAATDMDKLSRQLTAKESYSSSALLFKPSCK